MINETIALGDLLSCPLHPDSFDDKHKSFGGKKTQICSPHASTYGFALSDLSVQFTQKKKHHRNKVFSLSTQNTATQTYVPSIAEKCAPRQG
jgi:hypothetical protein